MTETVPETKTAKNINLNLVELVNLAAKLLHQMFLAAPKDKAKPLFKAIKGGELVPLGTMTIDQQLKANLMLALDYSEFVGPGFNFDVFRAALQAILQQISEKFKVQGDMNVMNSDDGQVLIHLPGMIDMKGQLNVLILSFELANLKETVIKLMFVDPSQYDAYRKDKP